VRPRLAAYAASAQRFKGLAAAAKADIILSNHTIYDGSKVKLPAVQARRPGQSNPYVVGPGSVANYLTTVGECAQAAVAGVR
jgi:metallo-beta-lactamase class B